MARGASVVRVVEDVTGPRPRASGRTGPDVASGGRACGTVVGARGAVGRRLSLPVSSRWPEAHGYRVHDPGSLVPTEPMRRLLTCPGPSEWYYR